jgi:hypothetical protein
MNVRFFTPFPRRALSVLLLALTSVMLAACMRSDGPDWGRLVLFSAVSGKLLDKGKPVAGLTLTRTVEWKGDTFVDSTVTDKGGGFAFPVLKKFGMLYALLPAEPRIDQTIKTVHQGKEYEIWGHLKGNYDNNGELFYVADSEREPYDPKTGYGRMMADPKKVPFTVTCELSTKVKLGADGNYDLKWYLDRGPKGNRGLNCFVD